MKKRQLLTVLEIQNFPNFEPLPPRNYYEKQTSQTHLHFKQNQVTPPNLPKMSEFSEMYFLNFWQIGWVQNLILFEMKMCLFFIIVRRR